MTLLKLIKEEITIPRICIGDFNQITDLNEKVGAAVRPFRQIDRFKEAMSHCSLHLLQTKDQRFTWSNNMPGQQFTKERLDRAIATLEWQQLFPNSTCHALPAVYSPLHLSLANLENRSGRRRFFFRYEATWGLREECSNIIKEAWRKVAIGDFVDTVFKKRLFNCQRALQQWKLVNNRQIPTNFKRNMKRLVKLQDNGTGNHLRNVQNHQGEIELYLAKEEMKWKQQAKQHWLQHGDRNTYFYHVHASQRRKTNYIKQLQDQHGYMISDHVMLGEMFFDFYSTLFTSSNPIVA